MHLIEIFLPATDNQGTAFSKRLFTQVREELVERFGGVTAFTRSPAHGEISEGGRRVHDAILIYEVMSDMLDAGWWATYRKTLESRFSQDEILIRATQVQKL